MSLSPPPSPSLRSADFRILVGAKRGTGSTGYTLSLDVVYVVVDYTAPSGYSLVMGQGSFSLSGQAASLLAGRKLAIDQGSYSLAGQAISFLRSYQLTMGQGTYTLTGQDIELIYTPPGGYTLVMGSGTYTLNGEDVAVLRNRLITMGNGTFLLLGQSISISRNYVLLMGHGLHTLAGQAISLLVSRYLYLAHGIYVLVGQDVAFYHILYEPEGDMITFGTLLTRIQAALGDPNGDTWDRTTVVWQWAQDALRDFPILRPKTYCTYSCNPRSQLQPASRLSAV